MKGMDLFWAVNDVNDVYIEEAAWNVEKAQTRRSICKAIVAVAAVLFVALVGNEVFFLQGELRYKVVKVSNIFQPQDEMQAGSELQDWKEMPLNRRYSQLCMNGVVYSARIEPCEEKEPGQFLGTFLAEGTECVRIGVLLYFDVEIIHEIEVDVYEMDERDAQNTVGVRFEENGRCYVYDRVYN